MSRSLLFKPGGGSTLSGLTANRIVTALDATHVETPASVVTDQGFLFTGYFEVRNPIIEDTTDPTKTFVFRQELQATATALQLWTGAQTADRELYVPVLVGNDTLLTRGTDAALTGVVSVRDSFKILGSGDATKTLRFELDAQTAGADLTIDSGAQTVDRTLTVPVLTGNRTLALIDQAQTFSAAMTFSSTLTVVDGNLEITGSSDATKKLKFEVDALTAAKTLTLATGAQTLDRTLTVPVLSGNDTLMALGVAQAVTGALTVRDSFLILGSADQTKTLRFECDAQTANADLVIDTGAQIVDRTLTVPVLTGNRTLALLDQAQSFSGIQTFSDTTDSTSTSTGGLLALGGIASAKTINALKFGVNGSFTPTLVGTGGGTAHTYVIQSGLYIKVGKRVDFSVNLALSAKDATMTGPVSIAGLPFANSAGGQLSFSSVLIAYMSGLSLTANYYQVSGYITTSDTKIQLLEHGNNLQQGVPPANVGAAMQVLFSGFYYTDS